MSESNCVNVVDVAIVVTGGVGPQISSVGDLRY